MKALLKTTLALVLVSTGPTPLTALNISEPPTVIYGRVVQVVGGREFLISQGELNWKIRNSSPGGREYTLRAPLEPLGDGRFSYRLVIPHQVLAYDLAVGENAVPLTAGGTRLQHGAITLDGRPVLLVAPAVDNFTAQQASRASTYRIDLQLAEPAVDSDGDGLPDWWEDQNGFDKWDPADPANHPDNPGLPGGEGGIAASARTFSEWRALLFPNATGDLEVFGREDPDQDGICNLLEYAFVLNPASKDETAARALPHAYLSAGKPGVAFRKRTVATDLVYQVDISQNLLDWRDGTTSVDEVNGPSGAENEAAFLSRAAVRPDGAEYFRVRVTRHQ